MEFLTSSKWSWHDERISTETQLLFVFMECFFRHEHNCHYERDFLEKHRNKEFVGALFPLLKNLSVAASTSAPSADQIQAMLPLPTLLNSVQKFEQQTEEINRVASLSQYQDSAILQQSPLMLTPDVLWCSYHYLQPHFRAVTFRDDDGDLNEISCSYETPEAAKQGTVLVKLFTYQPRHNSWEPELLGIVEQIVVTKNEDSVEITCFLSSKFTRKHTCWFWYQPVDQLDAVIETFTKMKARFVQRKPHLNKQKLSTAEEERAGFRLLIVPDDVSSKDISKAYRKRNIVFPYHQEPIPGDHFKYWNGDSH